MIGLRRLRLHMWTGKDQINNIWRHISSERKTLTVTTWRLCLLWRRECFKCANDPTRNFQRAFDGPSAPKRLLRSFDDPLRAARTHGGRRAPHEPSMPENFLSQRRRSPFYIFTFPSGDSIHLFIAIKSHYVDVIEILLWNIARTVSAAVRRRPRPALAARSLGQDERRSLPLFRSARSVCHSKSKQQPQISSLDIRFCDRMKWNFRSVLH